MSNGKCFSGNDSGDGNLYPAPEKYHEDVANNSTIFWETLKNFNCAMGSSLKIPVIGGQKLNLHTLYVEVTRRGGYDKVVLEKKWREISTLFKFSETTTSASYTLKKKYLSLLLPYEEVYFFRRRSPIESFSTELAISGTIDGKFDYGYLVSVNIGLETLKGILYHPVQQEASSSSSAIACTAIVPYDANPDHKIKRQVRKRKGDPSHPKRNKSGYNFFFAERHAILRSMYPGREREFTNMIGHSWKNLTTEEKMVYQNLGVKDKERYRREMKEYKEGIQKSLLEEEGEINMENKQYA